MDPLAVYKVLALLFASRVSRLPTFPDATTVSLLINATTLALSADPSLLLLTGPFVVVGDVHGNIDDLLRIFSRQGYPPEKRYLFLGDYVDRGPNSLDVLLLLYSFKVLFPDDVFLLRGNHEVEYISAKYGFKTDCLRHFTDDLYREFIESFRHLPFAAVLNSNVFAVHGGLSPLAETVDAIARLEKPQHTTDSRLAQDLVWSDPMKSDDDGFVHSGRGNGYFFSDDVLDEFLDRNHFRLLIRSHEACRRGFDRPLARCLTIFSTTDYTGKGNDAAVAVLALIGEYIIDKYRMQRQGARGKRNVTLPAW
jgi:diadenosine tetraphosphatase ApaH/serine/threonine PP2A family protein phosphatase